MGNHALVPAETKQDASLRDALRGALDHTPGTQTHPSCLPCSSLCKAGHCALPGSWGASRQPRVGSEKEPRAGSGKEPASHRAVHAWRQQLPAHQLGPVCRTRDNGFKLKEARFGLNMRKKLFILGVLRHWERF